MKVTSRVALGCAVLAIAAVTAACGSSNDDGSPSRSGSTATAPAATKMKVAYLPSTDFAPLLLAQKLGYYKQAGLDVDIVKYTVGSTLLPAVLKGDIQGTISSAGSLAIAVAQGLPLVMTNVFDRVGTDASKDTIQLLVPASSPIKTLAQLSGKTIGVNSAKNLTEVQIAEILRQKAGVKARYVTVPYPSQATALKAGTVAAVNAAEPFVTQMKSAQSMRELAGSNVDFIPRVALGIFVMSKAYVAKNPKAATAFMQATDKAIRYAAGNPQAVRDILPSMTGVTPDVANKTLLPEFYGDQIDLSRLKQLAAAEKNYGLMDTLPDMKSAIASIAMSKVTNQ